MPDIPPLVPSPRPYKKPKQKPTSEHHGKQHRALRKQLLAQYPICQYRFDGCTGWSTEADHKIYPARTLTDYIATCSHCHHIRHNINNKTERH